MIVRGRKWTQEEHEKLVKLKQQSLSFAEIATALNRTRKAVEWRWQVINFSAETRERYRKNRQENAARYRRKPRKTNPLRFVPETMIAPDIVLIERDMRLKAPQTITGYLFGDPPRGYSALDRREVRP